MPFAAAPRVERPQAARTHGVMPAQSAGVTLFAENEALELAEGLIQQRLLLLLVQVRVADRRRGRCGASGVAQLLPLAHVLVDVVLHEEPGTLVLRLVLAPHDLGCA